MAETITLGIVGIKNMGEYNADTSYEKLNVVTYEGSSYCALRDTVGNLPTDTDYWQLYAEKGDTGNTGDIGPVFTPSVSDDGDISWTNNGGLPNPETKNIKGAIGPQGPAAEPPVSVSSTSDMIDNTKYYVLTTDMHIYYYNGSQFVDSGIVYGTASDVMHGYGQSLDNATKWSAFNNDFNNLIANGIYTCNQPSSVVLTNAPYSNFNGTVIVYNHKENTLLGTTQLAYSNSYGFYSRQYWSSWGAWKRVARIDDIPINVMTGNNAEIYNAAKWSEFDNDFNNLIPNKIYLLDQNATVGGTLLNKPVAGNPSGILMSYCYKEGLQDGTTQLFVKAGSRDVYIRLKWSSNWSNWKRLLGADELNTIKNDNFNELYKAFDTVGIIGDSLASGESAYKDGETTKYVDIYEKSWGQYMARDSGNTYYNFSKGGLDTRTWFTNAVGYPTASDGNHKCKAYIIGLGVNDPRIEDYIGSSSDINLSDYTQNGDTFYGNYAKIIQTMKIQQPKAKFFLLTIPNQASAFNPFNEAIRYMATIFDNVYIIDLRQDYQSYFDTDSFIINNRRSGHFNAIAYEYIAKLFEQWISEYMYEHYSEFKQVEFIGTNYEWTD